MDNKQQTFIFIGRSGCGKGTQAKLLIDTLKDRGEQEVFYLETGQKFRELIKEPNYTSGLAFEVAKSGNRQPDFLAVHIWSHVFIKEYNGRQNLVIDGTPRSKNEAIILDTAMKFYNQSKPHIIHMNVSNEWSMKRLTERGRGDDKTSNGIEKRLAWFENDVIPAIEYYKEHPDYNFIEINGEQSIEDVHKEIMSKVFGK